jgi:hypothetical protein
MNIPSEFAKASSDKRYILRSLGEGEHSGRAEARGIEGNEQNREQMKRSPDSKAGVSRAITPKFPATP